MQLPGDAWGHEAGEGDLERIEVHAREEQRRLTLVRRTGRKGVVLTDVFHNHVVVRAVVVERRVDDVAHGVEADAVENGKIVGAASAAA
jgi:hypothetical protein